MYQSEGQSSEIGCAGGKAESVDQPECNVRPHMEFSYAHRNSLTDMELMIRLKSKLQKRLIGDVAEEVAVGLNIGLSLLHLVINLTLSIIHCMYMTEYRLML